MFRSNHWDICSWQTCMLFFASLWEDDSGGFEVARLSRFTPPCFNDIQRPGEIPDTFGNMSFLEVLVPWIYKGNSKRYWNLQVGLVQFGSSISFVEYIYIYISRIEVLLLLFDVHIHSPYFSKYGSMIHTIYVYMFIYAPLHISTIVFRARSHSCSCGH